jgi:outer membrane protein OmpA-like peptidoglycan-associated protein
MNPGITSRIVWQGGARKGFWFLLLLPVNLFCPERTDAQNLLANGGFEDENICTEYSKNCAPEAWIASSLRANYYFDAPGFAHSGTHFAGLIAGSRIRMGIRSFIRTRLLCGLQKGHLYKLEFFVRSLHEVLDSISVYFSSNDFLFDRRYFKDIQPQLWVINGLDSPSRPSPVWHRVRFEYRASGEEEFITIGNFKRDDYVGFDRPDFENNYYFFIDDVSLTPRDANERLCLEADSVKQAIYSENDRHDLLERKIYQYRKKPPFIPRLPQTVTIRVDTLLIPDLFFATADYHLNKESHQVLDDFCKGVGRRKVDSLIIEGHTDSVGSLEYNQKLSQNRAMSVEQYILERTSLAREKFLIRYFASLRPAATNSTQEGRQKNRRVEIYLYSRE